MFWCLRREPEWECIFGIQSMWGEKKVSIPSWWMRTIAQEERGSGRTVLCSLSRCLDVSLSLLLDPVPWLVPSCSKNPTTVGTMNYCFRKCTCTKSGWTEVWEMKTNSFFLLLFSLKFAGWVLNFFYLPVLKGGTLRCHGGKEAGPWKGTYPALAFYFLFGFDVQEGFLYISILTAV